jgi:hypothetical protein
MLKSPWKARVGLFLAGMALLNGTFALKSWRLIREGFPDFTIFYCAATIVRTGHGAQLYDQAMQLRVQREFASAERVRNGPLPYNHPPFEAAFFLPLSWLPYVPAFITWAGLNVGVLIALYYLLKPRFPCFKEISLASWLLFCVAFFPVYVALLQGQDVLLFIFLLTLAFVALEANRDWTGGVCLGLGLFRFHLLLPVLLGLLLQRRLRTILAFSLAALALFGVSVGLVGIETTLSYPRYVNQIEVDMLQRGTIELSNMTNLRGLLQAVFHSVVPRGIGDGLAILLSAALAAYAAATWKRTPELRSRLGFAVCLIAALLSAYHGLIHDSSLELLTSVIIADYVLAHGSIDREGWLLIIPIFIFCFTPLQSLLWYQRWQGSVIPVTLLFWLWRIRHSLGALPTDGVMPALLQSSSRTGA